MFFGVIADAYFDTKTHFLFPLIIHESTLSCNFIGFFYDNLYGNGNQRYP